jgi:hypothetical protein
MGSMSASDAAPLPRLGEVFFDVRGSSRSMRLSWYSDTGVAVLSIWQGGTCTGTFRLPIDDLPRMVEALQRGPRGAALPAGEARDQERGQERGLGAERQRRGITAASTEAMPAVASFSDYATGQIAPVTGEFRSMSGPAEPAYRDDPLGSGAYPAYRAPDRGRDRGQDRDRDSTGGSFPGYADDGPPVYRDSSPPPPAYGDDPLGARGYRDDPLGSGGYPAYRDRAPETADNGSRPGHRDGDPYRNDPLGSGYRSERPPPSYDPYPPSYRNEPAPYPAEAPYPAAAPGQRYDDDPFQSVYPEDSREPGHPEDERTGSHPYGPPPGRTEPRVPRGRS